MATAVFFHAHPDDESIATGGTMARAAAEGHRVVLVLATRGEHGEVPEGYLPPGETLTERRVVETHAAAEILGVARVEFLGYVDSGMVGTPTNDAPDCFWQADLDEAAGRLAAILRDEGAEVLTVYDENGAYGHPDHIQVHRVGVRAAEMAGTPRVYESTVDRDRIASFMAAAAGSPGVPDAPVEDMSALGVPGEMITTEVDVREHLEAKRKAMAAHGSQIAETSFFLALPPDLFEAVWGLESYVRRGAVPGPVRETSLFT